MRHFEITYENEQLLLTLLVMGGAFHPPLSENRNFSRTEPPLDLRPVCKVKFVRCGPVEKNQSALSFFDKIPNFPKILRGRV